MKQNYFRYYKPGFIIGLILILGSIFGALMTWLIDAINTTFDLNYYQYPGTSVIVIAIIVLIDKKLWKHFPFKVLYMVPDISGRYEGNIYYTHPETGDDGTKKCAVEIFQTGSKVKFNCYFQNEDGKEKTPSRSLVETIVQNEDNTYSLVFTYQNDGLIGKFAPHNGTNILKYIENNGEKFLKGLYYTNREPFQTRGTMEVKLITKQLENDY